MNYRGHLIFGFLLSAFIIALFEEYFYPGLFPVYNLDYFIYAVITIFIFSLLPDVDLKQSKISKFFGVVSLLGLFFSSFFLVFIEDGVIFDTGEILSIFWISFLLLVFNFYSSTLKHRHFTHSYLFLVIVLALLIPVFHMTDYSLALLALISFISHLVGDKMPLGSKNF